MISRTLSTFGRGLGLAGLAALVLSAPAALAQDDDAAKGPLKRMQGTWTSTSDDGDGKWVIEGDTATVTLGEGNTYKATMTVDRKAKPWTIDFTIKESPYADIVGKTVLGIVEREGNKTLRICVGPPGGERPEEFEAEPEEAYLYTLTRTSKEPEDDPDEPEPADPKTADLGKMQGTWTSPLQDGTATWVIEKDHMVLSTPNRKYQITLMLDPSAQPNKSVDFRVDDGPDDAKGQTAFGIYKFDGESLVFCASMKPDQRPDEFKNEMGEAIVFTLTKKKS